MTNKLQNSCHRDKSQEPLLIDMFCPMSERFHTTTAMKMWLSNKDVLKNNKGNYVIRNNSKMKINKIFRVVLRGECCHRLGDFPLDKLLKLPFFVQPPMSRSISIQIRNSNEQAIRWNYIIIAVACAKPTSLRLHNTLIHTSTIQCRKTRNTIKKKVIGWSW